MALVRYEALLLGLGLLRVASGSQTVDDRANYAKSVIFTEKQTNKKSPLLFCFVTVLYTTEI